MKNRVKKQSAEEGVSTVLSYILTLSTALLLLLILMVVYQNITAGPSNIVMYDSLQIVGGDIALRVETIDRIIDSRRPDRMIEQLETSVDVPYDIGGKIYYINFTQHELSMETTDSAIYFKVPMNLTTNLTSKTLSSTQQKVKIFYNNSSGRIDFE